MWLKLSMDLIYLALILLIGVLSAGLILEHESRKYALSLGFPIGAGLYSWLLFLFSWAGLRLTKMTILSIGLTMLILFGSLTLIRRRSKNPRKASIASTSIRDRNLLARMVVVVILALFVIAAVLAIGRAYSSWDAMAIWSIKGYGIASSKSIFGGETWGAFGLTYPLNVPLQIAAFRNISGDLLPESKVIFPLFFASLVFSCYNFYKEEEVSEKSALLGSLIMASLPIAFEHSTQGYANLGFTTYLVLGILLGIQGIFQANDRYQLMGGILMGFACWTRPEGVLFLPFVVVGAVLVLRLNKFVKVSWLGWLLPPMLIAGSWLIFARTYASESLVLSTLQQAAEQLNSGHLNIDAFYRIARFMGHQLLRPSIWGVLLMMLVPLVVINRRNLRPSSDPVAFACLLMGVSITTATTLHFYMISFLGTLTDWLPTSANRMYLPSGILFLVWVILLSEKKYNLRSSLMDERLTRTA